MNVPHDRFIHQLPKTQATLFLRLLGREGNQERAIQEFTQSPDSALHATIEELLADYRTKLESRNQRTQDEEELFMNLSAAYLKRKEEWMQEAVQQTRQETAIILLREGMSIDLIVKATGLSIAQVTQLQQQL